MLLRFIGTVVAVFSGFGYVIYRDSNKDDVNDKRKQERDAWRIWSREITNLSSSEPFTDSTNSNSTRIHHNPSLTSSLEIQDKSGDAVISISEIADPRPKIWKNVNSSRNNPILRLNQLLSAVPTTTVAGNIAKTNYMVVHLPQGFTIGDLNPAKNMPGKLEPIIRKGKIVKHARLSNPDQLTRIVKLGAIWQISSFIVGQIHLHDINRKLETISHQVEEFSTFLKNDRMSKILGCQKYFTQISEDIEQGIIMPERSKTVIENQCVEILKIEEHLRLEFIRAIDDIKKAGLSKSSTKNLQILYEVAQQLCICIETRLLGYKLMAIESEDRSLASNRLNGVQRDITWLKDRVIHFADYIVDTLSEEASFWSDLGKLKDALVALENFRIRSKLQNSFMRVRDEIIMAQSILEQREEPHEILLKVNGGEIDGYAVTEDARK